MKTNSPSAYSRSLNALNRSKDPIEALEPRIAPAVIIVNAHTATYTDIDGDRVTIQVSKGVLTPANFVTVATGLGDQLQTIDLSAGGFDGANLTMTVKKAAGGDGLAHVGYINSLGHDLGSVTVRGDLGQIDAGDANAADGAIRALAVRSMGRFGLETQAINGHLISSTNGSIGKITVTEDIIDALITIAGGANGRLGSLTIGGSLIGGTDSNSGSVSADGNMGPVRIGHNLQGGTGGFSGSILAGGTVASIKIGGSLIGGAGIASGVLDSVGDMGPVTIAQNLQAGTGILSGRIEVDGRLASLTIGGSFIGGADEASGSVSSVLGIGPVKITHDLVGGSGEGSARIVTNGNLASLNIGGTLFGGTNRESGNIFIQGNIGPVKIGGDLQGGSGFRSGTITSSAGIANVTIGGSLIGGTNNGSGTILSEENMGRVTIKGDLTGGSIAGDATLLSSGLIFSGGRIAGVTIGGSIISGIDSSLGELIDNASIRAGDDIGFLTVRGSIVGNSAGDDSPVIISARGQANPGATLDTAIGKITVGGRVEFAQILAGYDTTLAPVNGDASIGPVKVGGAWVASNLVAGVAAGSDGQFGTEDDASIGGTRVSRIASIIIGGQVIGTAISPGIIDHFGFVAERIGSFRAGLFVAPLTGGTDVIELSPTTADVTLREV